MRVMRAPSPVEIYANPTFDIELSTIIERLDQVKISDIEPEEVNRLCGAGALFQTSPCGTKVRALKNNHDTWYSPFTDHPYYQLVRGPKHLKDKSL